ncbi:MAG TPA: hypothetical protein VJC16_00360 [Candidatus Nanoarchaeia archaeon]|nr:hypothetical protein [Candidatus Nanoarchaeia archaeon]
MSTPLSRRECVAALAAPLFAFFDQRPSPAPRAEQRYITPTGRRPTERHYLISGPMHTRGRATYTISPDGDEISLLLDLSFPAPYRATFLSKQRLDGLTEFMAQDDAYVHSGQNVLSYFADIAGLYAMNGTIDQGTAEVVISHGERLRLQATLLQRQPADGLTGILVQPVTQEGIFDPIAFSKLLAYTGAEIYLDQEGVCRRARALFTNGKEDFAYHALLQK